MWPMVAAHFLKTRVSLDEKERVHAIAQELLITESVWLKRLVLTALCESPQSKGATRLSDNAQRRGSEARLYVRLRSEDRLLLRERAAARAMPAATYISVLVRAHLRSLTPLPHDELTALKRSVAELSVIGRNLNQIARLANQGGRVTGPSQSDLRAILKVCEALRDHVKALIQANVDTWEIGHAQDSR